MAKIAMIMPNAIMMKYAQDAALNCHTDVRIYQSDSDHVLDTLAFARKEGAVMAVTRGNLACILRQETDIPLVTIKISGQELIQMLDEARRLLEQPEDLIAFVSFPEMLTELEPITDILKVRVKAYIANNAQDVESRVIQAHKDGAKILIGGTLAQQAAEKLGIKTISLKSSRASIESALNDAKHVLFGIEMAQRQTAEITSLLNSTFDAILKLDKGGNIQVANFMAERVFRQPQAQLVGKNVFDLIESHRDSPFTRALLEKRNAYSSVVMIGQEEHVASLNVLQSSDGFEGFVLALQAFRHIDDMSNTIRQNAQQVPAVYKARRQMNEYHYPSQVMRNLCSDAAIVAQYDLPVVITGVPGSSRTRLAECIHNASPRAEKPYVHLDLSALSPEMQVNQMRTPADSVTGRHNAFQIASDGGTVMLEHFNCLCEEAQPLFKHILTRHYILRSDGMPYYRFDGRIICTVDVNIQHNEWVMPPLPFDFSFFELRVPSLEQRQEDLPVLLDEYLEIFCKKYKKYVRVPADIKARAFTRKWKRDEREFRCFVEKLVLLSDYYEANAELIDRLVLEPNGEQETLIPHVVVDSSEEARLIAALKKYRGNRTDIAAAFGISKATLWRKLKKYNLNNMRF